jgi:hypothetical protein
VSQPEERIIPIARFVPQSSPAAVTHGGAPLAPGVVMVTTGSFTEKGLSLGDEAVLAYFDSGLYRPGKNDPAYIALGYVVCPTKNGIAQPQVAQEAFLDAPSSVIAQGGIRLPRLSPELRSRIADSPVMGGTQLWDMVAAQHALARLREAGHRGEVRVIGDGEQVIRFMNNSETRLTLKVGEMDIAPDLRAELLATAASFEHVDWEWVPREKNPADATVRKLLERYTKGFRKGRTVRDIGNEWREELQRGQSMP